jgi:hypothetical protein
MGKTSAAPFQGLGDLNLSMRAPWGDHCRQNIDLLHAPMFQLRNSFLDSRSTELVVSDHNRLGETLL